MRTKFYFVAALAATMLASCADDKFVGENSPNELQNESAENAINFAFNTQNITRGDITGLSAAQTLGNFFYVMGTKADMTLVSPNAPIPANSPTTKLVFDNYLVQYTENTAGQTESNTANWDYVGLNPGTTPADKPKLSSITGEQTIKYWDYSSTQYDFFAFSTGNRQPVNSLTPGDITAATQVGVTKMLYGSSLVSNPAYSFYIPTEDALKQVYITDITPVEKDNFKKEVSLKFKNLGSKVRVALYETVPGYAVSDVKFYTVDQPDNANPLNLGVGTTTDATLISTGTIPTSGTIAVSFPHIGTDKSSEADYNKASVNVTEGAGKVTYHGFGALTSNYVAGENVLTGDDYLGRTLPTATFAGEKADKYFTTVFPVSSSNALTLRVDYTLTAIDGSGEQIKVYGAKASVPANYTVWRPNYAYTYIFKISDATNGWTDTGHTAQGLFPITFDAVVAEPTEFTGEQTTVTTVATPSITTYQQGHNNSTNEYSNTKDIYVQVMNTAVSPAEVITGLTATNSLVYELSKDVTEAFVLDALTMRTTAVADANVTGRNGLGLTKITTSGHVNNDVEEIDNGVDDNPITPVTKGTVCKIANAALTAGKSYAYVYVQTDPTGTEKNIFEPIDVTDGQKINSSETDHVYYIIKPSDITGGSTLGAAETPDEDYVYFSLVVDGNGGKKYYYISTLGKDSVPAGSIKVAKNTSADHKANGGDNADGNNFYFDKYIRNTGKYAVKVIKVV